MKAKHFTLILTLAGACQSSPSPQARPPAIGPTPTTIDRAQVIARSDGEGVAAGELDDSVKGGIIRADNEHAQKLHDLREEGLDKLINDRLVAKKAKAAGVTSEKLLETEVYGKVDVPTEKETKDLYDQ